MAELVRVRRDAFLPGLPGGLPQLEVLLDRHNLTLAARAVQPGAAVEWRTASPDGALADAAPTTAGFQAALDPGANALTARVTAPDGTTVRDYTLTVTRETGTRLACTATPAAPGSRPRRRRGRTGAWRRARGWSSTRARARGAARGWRT